MLLLVAISAFGLNPDERPLLLVVAGIGLVGAGAVWRFGWWGKVVGCAVAVGMVMTLFWTAFSISSFTSFFDFVPAVLVVPGAILAFASCIAALVAGRRGHRGASPTGGERGGIRVALGVVVLLAVGSGLLTLTSRSTVGAAGVDSTVMMKSFKFTAKTYVLTTADQDTTLRVRVAARNSRGSASSTSAPSAVIVKAEAPGGSTVSITQNSTTLPFDSSTFSSILVTGDGTDLLATAFTGPVASPVTFANGPFSFASRERHPESRHAPAALARSA